MCVCVFMYVYIYVFMSIYVCMYICVCIYIYMCVCVCLSYSFRVNGFQPVRQNDDLGLSKLLKRDVLVCGCVCVCVRVSRGRENEQNRWKRAQGARKQVQEGGEQQSNRQQQVESRAVNQGCSSSTTNDLKHC